MKTSFSIALLGILLLLAPASVNAQIGMNQWRIHYSAFNAQGVAETDSEVYMACTNGVVRYDFEDNTINQLTVTNGLSDLGISCIKGFNNVVIVGYINGNLDVIEGTDVTNIPWIKVAEISGDKTINNFFFTDEYIYVATGIGLIVFDNAKKEIKDTYYPYSDPEIFDVTVYRDTLYTATANGIYYAPEDRPFLNDLANWEKKEDLPITVVNSKFTEIDAFADELFFAYNGTEFNADTVYRFKNGVLNVFQTDLSINDLNVDDDQLVMATFAALQSYDTNLEEMAFLFDYADGTPRPVAGLFKEGNYWIADANNGLVKGLNPWDASSIYNNSPATDGSFRMDIQFGKVLVAGGGVTENLQNNYFRNGVYLFEDEEWKNYNYLTDDNIDNNKDWDFISVTINQNNTDEFAFSSFSEGGLKIVKEGGAISEVYTNENSILEAQLGVMAIADMQYDKDGNLWVINKGFQTLKVFTATGEQYAYSLGAASNEKFPYRLLIDNDGNKWIAVTNVGLIAFNENGTFEDTSDDQFRTLSASEGYGNLPSIIVRAIAQDADGEIWIGTEEGLVILYSRNDLYEGGFGDYDASPILLEVDGEVERLLGETNISAIAIDGGNRKWIGTSSAGVFCFSEDGTEEVYRFTTENSPLVSNSILDIKVDQLSGEVYFATNQGLVSFRSDATLADNSFSTVSVFPNPVRPDFSGPITIQGLGYESDVKITDISGNLIYQTVSNGGSVIWDGNTLQGDRVQSGVYLVWSGVTFSKGKNVAKILFIN